MKKALLTALAVVSVLAGCKKDPPVQPPPEPVEQTKAQVPPADQPGGKVTFKLSYRGLSGKSDEPWGAGRCGFGSTNEESAFIKAVKDQTENKLYISKNPFLAEQGYTAIEYKDKEVLYAYFDLNADSKLSDNERLSPLEVQNRYDAFLTPDFTVTNEKGQDTPFRLMLMAHFYPNEPLPNITWTPMGIYEGVAKLAGKEMRMLLLPDFSSQCYEKYGASRYSLLPDSPEIKGYVEQQPFSSLIVHNKQFYRMTVDAVTPAEKTITVSLTEDKSPRGEFALDIKGKEPIKNKLNYAYIQGADDNTVFFGIQEDMPQLPVGKYTISYAGFGYGKETTEEYYTSFQSKGVAFAVESNRKTMIELGEPKVNVQAIEQEKRYHNDKVYKDTFTEGTVVYIDASFTGIGKEIYRDFRQQDKGLGTLKARIKIVDDTGNEITNKELEYG